MNLKDFLNNNDISPAKVRRSSLINQMHALNDEGKNCSSCKGYCCTYHNNSMQVTPLEAVDAYLYLKENKMINEELILLLEENIKRYRLDVEVPTKGGGALRRYYTCPFYAPGSKGCHLSLEDKPYGCLAFNPLKKSVSEEGNCESNQNLLQKRFDQNIQETEHNEILKSYLGLYWNKRNLPWALLELIKQLN